MLKDQIQKIRSRDLRTNATNSEKVLWGGLRKKYLGGFKFRRQQPLGKYIVDFVCLEARVIVELDGNQHLDQLAYDQQRDAWLKEQGFEILRFSNNELFERSHVVLDVIKGACNRRQGA